MMSTDEAIKTLKSALGLVVTNQDFKGDYEKLFGPETAFKVATAWYRLAPKAETTPLPMTSSVHSSYREWIDLVSSRLMWVKEQQNSGIGSLKTLGIYGVIAYVGYKFLFKK